MASRLDTTGPHAGWVVLHPQNGRLIDGVSIGPMFCPSSPLPQFNSVGGFRVGMPSYVGNSGAAHDAVFAEKRVSPCCSTKGGEISGGGILIPNAAVRRREIKDGASHTLIVGETSNYCFGKGGVSYRVDGGFPNGWLTGTVVTGTPPAYSATSNLGSWNVTTTHHPINTRDYELMGISDNAGPNNPLLSAHPGGVEALLVDGSVQFLADQTEVLTLKQLATRDDGELASH